MSYFLLPVMPLRIAPPILRSNPCLVVGIPTARATLVFKPEIPTARLSEKLSPGIFAINILIYLFNIQKYLLALIIPKIGQVLQFIDIAYASLFDFFNSLRVDIAI